MKKLIAILFLFPLILSFSAQLLAQCDNSLSLKKPSFIYTEHAALGDNIYTVTDEKTGLVWLKCPLGLSGEQCTSGSAELLTWQQALDKAALVRTDANEALAGQTDWRLPSIAELRTLVEDACYNPAANQNVLPELYYTNGSQVESGYWSSSPYVRKDDATDNTNPHLAWLIEFSTGQENVKKKDSLYRVIFVRDR